MQAVILVHGLWTNAGVMALHRRWLRRAGFAVGAISYPSWSEGLADNARRLSRAIAEMPGDIVHLVAHSLGGLVALRLLADQPDSRLRRVVLMGTPCAGSRSASVVLSTPLLAPLIGRTYREWCRQPTTDIRAGVEVGVIAGTRPIGMGRLITTLPTPNDGMITVAETQLAAARARIHLPVCHTGMLLSRACARQAAGFLRSGAFGDD